MDQSTNAAIASSLVIVRAGEHLLPSYLATYFGSALCVEEIATYAGGAAQPNLSGKNLGAFKLPLPSLADQNEIAGLHKHLKRRCTALEEVAKAKLADLDALRQSLLQKAFSGGLS